MKMGVARDSGIMSFMSADIAGCCGDAAIIDSQIQDVELLSDYVATTRNLADAKSFSSARRQL